MGHQTIYVVTMRSVGEVMAAMHSILEAKEFVKNRVSYDPRWEYHNSHGSIWITKDYTIQATTLR